jgi:hypothetical protein
MGLTSAWSHAAERDQSGEPKGGGSGPVLGGEVVVLHLPRVIEHVVGRMSDEERQRPRSHRPLDLPVVVGADRRDVCLAVLVKSSRCERALFGDP